MLPTVLNRIGIIVKRVRMEIGESSRSCVEDAISKNTNGTSGITAATAVACVREEREHLFLIFKEANLETALIN